MKAMLVNSYGGPEVLQPGTVSDPVAGAGEVVVKVAATSINPIDVMRRSGLTRDDAPLTFPAVLGYDLAGTVVSLGEGVTTFSVGDPVFGMADKTYAELCVTTAVTLARVPEGMELVDAARLPVVTITGHLLALATRASAGDTVLVTGAVGNVGRSAVYQLKQMGAVVIAAVLGNQVTEAGTLGADQIVTTDDEQAFAQISQLSAVADAVGGKTAQALIAKVRDGGTFASVLGAPANAADYPGVHVEAVYGSPNAEVALQMALAVQSGTLEIPIGKRMPLADAAAAHQQIADRSVKGKILLVADENLAARSEAETAIKALLAKYNAALNESATADVLPLYTEDGIFMAPFAPSAIGQQAIHRAYDHVFTILKFDVLFTLLELVVLSPDYAYGRTASAGTTVNPQTGNKTSEGNQELFVFRKDADRQWKIARYSFSPIAPPRL